MQTLFPLLPSYPPGFSYQDDFISLAEEQDLIAAIQKIALNPMQFQGYEAKRKVASFGYDWSFEKRELKKENQSPLNLTG